MSLDQGAGTEDGPEFLLSPPPTVQGVTVSGVLPTIALLFELTVCCQWEQERENLVQHRPNREQELYAKWYHEKLN